MAQVANLTGEGYLWALALLLAAGFGATAPWRLIGVFLSQRLTIDSEVLVWVRAVSTALIAGLVARMVLLPAGALAGVPLWLRLLAFGAAIATFLLVRRSLGAGVFFGAMMLVAGQWYVGG